MTNLFLDIETLPTDRADVRDYIASTITPPANLKKPESIAAWKAEKKGDAIDEAISKTGLDGAFGRICVIGWAWNDEGPQYTALSEPGQAGDEKGMLGEFALALEMGHKRNHLDGYPTVIGHNIINFDLRFLWQRCMVNGIRLPAWFPRDPKPWDDTVFDTMLRFAGQRGTIGLDRLCLALGLPGKDGIDGSMVADLWAKDPKAVADYCMADVERTRAVYRKMSIAFGEAA